MKKTLAIITSIALILCLSATAFAATDEFVSSPSGGSGPTVVDFKPDDEGCTGTLIVTPYINKDTLPEEDEKLMDKAHQSLTDADDLTGLNSDFSKLVKEKKINSKNLAVGDLFDLTVTGCSNHENHHGFSIVLGASLKNFVGLLQMNANGEWVLVKNAKVIENGKNLSFHVDSLSPMAIIVETGSQSSPKTGDNGASNLWIVLTVASLSAIAFVFAKKKVSD